MHEAYNITNILQLTVQVECLAAYEDTLFVGTRQGHLYMYSVTLKDDKPEVSLMRLNKSFSKKAIQQIEVIPELDLIICLSDNCIQIHNTKEVNFPVIQQMENTKGASFFAIHSQTETSLTGKTVALVRMCVSIKRKLLLFYLKHNEFTPFENKAVISLKDIPKTIIWCGETICVGYKSEYCLYTLNPNDKPVDLFTTGSRSTEPCLAKINDNTFAVGRENQTVTVDDRGSAATSKVLKWSDTPTGLVWDNPYLLGILPDTIQVQNLEPGGVTQVLGNLPKVRLITRAKQGLLIAASISNVWCIHAIDVATQRKVLLDDKQFQLAIQITHTSNESKEEKSAIIHHIQTLLAYDLFRNKEFFKSMKEFLALKTDPYEVIRLYPDLLPQSSTEPTDTYEKLTDVEQEKAIQALIDYLTDIRRNTQADVQANVNASGNLNEKPITTKSTQQLLQIIDTTLLKCYLQTNDALIAPLLRLNYCHLAETEKTLKKHGKHNELIILYQMKGQHRKALALLQSEGTIDRTINYLQKLGPELMGLIFEFADWVLKKSPEEGLKIFIEETTEVEKLPRPRVLDHLMRSHTSLVIPYAEHVVHNWNDTNPLFHNTLVHFYKEKAVSNDTSATHAKKKLHDFLQNSRYYTAETVLASFPTDKLLEERAIILGRLGRHEQALAIYVRILGDVQRAKEYCEEVYNPDNPTNKDVYLHLLQILLNPKHVSLSIPNVTLSPKTAEPDMDLALDYLETYASKIDPFKALQLLPEDIPMSRINKFVQVALHRKTKERRWEQLLGGLLYAEYLQCQEIRLQLLNRSFLINDLNLCSVCKKRFGNQSALVHYPNGNIVHYSCQDKNNM